MVRQGQQLKRSNKGKVSEEECVGNWKETWRNPNQAGRANVVGNGLAPSCNLQHLIRRHSGVLPTTKHRPFHQLVGILWDYLVSTR